MHQGHHFAMLLRKAYLTFHRSANVALLADGITADQYVLLNAISEDPGVMQVDIVERTASDSNTVAAALKRLELRRLIRRETHARDGRARSVFLTPEGRRVLRRASKAAAAIPARLQECLPDQDRLQMEEMLQHIYEVFSSPHPGVNGESKRQTSKRKSPT